jgi:hypothetical protein
MLFLIIVVCYYDFVVKRDGRLNSFSLLFRVLNVSRILAILFLYCCSVKV